MKFWNLLAMLVCFFAVFVLFADQSWAGWLQSDRPSCPGGACQLPVAVATPTSTCGRSDPVGVPAKWRAAKAVKFIKKTALKVRERRHVRRDGRHTRR